MNWDAIGSVAELLGAAGVIVSLLYLSYQIRINTKTVKAEATQTTYTGWSDFNYDLSKHPNAVEIDRMWKPDSQWDDFSAEEKVKLGWVCRSIVERFEAEFSLYGYPFPEQAELLKRYMLFHIWRFGQWT